MSPNTRSCDLSALRQEEQPITEQPKSQVFLEGVPAEKAEAIMAYVKTLRKKFPHMKPARLQRKVAEHFKIQLV